jgi:hypothetical protein
VPDEALLERFETPVTQLRLMFAKSQLTQKAMTCDKVSRHRTWRHNHVRAAVRYGGTTAGCDTSWEPKEGLMKDKELGDKGHGKRGHILISVLDDLLMVDISCVHPTGGTMRGKKSKQAAAATARDKAKRRDHAKDGAPGYTFVPFSIETYGRLGVEADKLLKDLAKRQLAQEFGKGMCFYIGSRKRSR